MGFLQFIQLLESRSQHQQPELRPHTKGKPAHTAESIHRGREPATSEAKLTRMAEKRLARMIANEAYRTLREKGETGLSGRLCIAHFWSNSVYLVHSVHFSLNRSIRSNLVYFGSFWSNLVNQVYFSPICSIRSNSVHSAIWSISVQLGPFRSIGSNSIYLIQFHQFGALT